MGEESVKAERGTDYKENERPRGLAQLDRHLRYPGALDHSVYVGAASPLLCIRSNEWYRRCVPSRRARRDSQTWGKKKNCLYFCQVRFLSAVRCDAADARYEHAKTRGCENTSARRHWSKPLAPTIMKRRDRASSQAGSPHNAAVQGRPSLMAMRLWVVEGQSPHIPPHTPHMPVPVRSPARCLQKCGLGCGS